MKFRNTLIAAAVVASSVASANASTFSTTASGFDLRGGLWINADNTDNVTAPVLGAGDAGSFSQSINFSTANAGNYNFHIETYSNISNFTWTLDAGSANAITGSGAFYNGKSADAVLSLSADTTHTITLNGVFNYSALPADQSQTATWYGAVTAPVPEPESYAMLLAGLGLVGMISRRRNKADVA